MIIRMPSDDCYFINWEERAFSGFTNLDQPKIQAGDFLHCDMQSNQIAEFKIVKVDYFPHNPEKDKRVQYVGRCEDVRYIEIGDVECIGF